MAPVSIPSRLRSLLAGSTYESATLAFADAVGLILTENQMPFFPAYTDHGVDHIEGVLETSVRLIPESVFEDRMLNAEDAAVLSCSAMLHDLALHLHETGFVDLIENHERYQPQPWFSTQSEDRSPDLSWIEVWREFQREARHFGTGQLDVILGPGANVPKVAFEDRLEPKTWVSADRLLIGEFIRRHHARLAHEIACFGFPGLHPQDFPILVDQLGDLGNAAGAVARSHGEPLTVMRHYLGYVAPGNLRPKGALLLYAAGLLRVADYLQLQADRAPVLLLRLKDPQSVVSIEEWQKHGAVSSISWDHDDPLAIYIALAPDHGLRTHLAIGELFNDLQREMDVTSATLDAEFGAGELSALNLRKRRIVSDLNQQSLRDRLPYVPARAMLKSDPDLFRLVVADLYGRQPAVAGRELIQNAVDAVRARHAFELQHQEKIPDSDLITQQGDVVVALMQEEDDRWLLKVSDRGIGLSPEVVIDYFLQAGASFGPSSAELADLSVEERIQTMKAGRFGIGAFAAFLLGPELRVTTRRVGEDRGIRFQACIDEDLIELRWTDAPIGTVVEVPFEASKLPAPGWSTGNLDPVQLFETISEFYRLTEPRVAFAFESIKTGTRPTAGDYISSPEDVPNPERPLPVHWRKIRAPGFDSVIWEIKDFQGPPFDRPSGRGRGTVVHNGILIRDLSDRQWPEAASFVWSDPQLERIVNRPAIAVFDSQQRLPLALHRYSLGDRRMPFEDDLLEAIGMDLVAHGVIIGPGNHPLQRNLDFSGVFSQGGWLPMLPTLMQTYIETPVLAIGISKSPHPSDAMSSEDVNQLFQGEGLLPWEDFPHQMAVLANSGLLNLSQRDTRQIEPALNELDQNIASWALLFGARPRGTVVALRDADWASPGRLSKTYRSGHPSHLNGFRELESETTGVFMKIESENAKLERDLLAATRSIQSELPGSGVAVTLFEGFVGSQAADSFLAGPWIRHIDGSLDLSPERRRNLGIRIADSDSDLKLLMGNWQEMIARSRST